MAYLRESDVRQAARSSLGFAREAASVLSESVRTASITARFDVFLCHSVRDAEIVLGSVRLLESQGLSVYVDWIVDPQMDRSAVTVGTAEILRQRMRQSKSLVYLFSQNSQRSRWMPWELGYFDGQNGTVGILPIAPDVGALDFSQEEYLGLYPKIELQSTGVWVNRTKAAPVSKYETDDFRSFSNWVSGAEKLRPRD